MDVNPGYPSAFGVQWLAADSHWSILNKTPVRLVDLPATAAETVTALRMHINDSGATGQTFTSVMEIFDGPLAVPTSTITVCAPNADAPGGTIGASGWRKDPGAVLTNLWQAIDDPYAYPPPSSTLATYIETATGTSTPYHFYLATGGIPLTSRILRVRFRAVFGALLGTGPQANRRFSFRAVHDPGGAGQSIWDIPEGIGVWGTGFTTAIDLDLGEINPVTRRPWTPQDIREFDGGSWAMRISANANTQTTGVVFMAQFLVSHVPENRVAVGVWERPAGQGPGLITTDSLVRMPSGAAGWPKPSSGQFKYGWRIADDRLLRPAGVPDQSSVGWLVTRSRLTAGVDTPPEIAAGSIAGTTHSNDLYGRYIPEPVFSPGQFVPALQLMVGAAVSTDSFAYGRPPGGDGAAIATLSTQVAQRMTPPSNQSFLGVRFIVFPPAAATSRTLTVSVHRVSDGVQMGGSFTVTSAEVRAGVQSATPNFWVVERFLSAGAVLVAGTQYELRFTVAGSGNWQFPRLQALSAGGWTFGGTTNGLRVGGTVHTDSDMPGVLLQQPAQPTSLSAEVLPVLAGDGVDCKCNVPAVDAVTVSWVNPAIGAFDRTEIWRFEDRGDWPLSDDAWELVHTRTTSSGTANSWTDWTAPRGVPVQYRLRNYVASGAFSEWLPTQFVTPQPYGCELIFTSNFSPELTVVYQHEPSVQFAFPDHDTDQLVRLQNRPLQVAFIDPTDRGVPKTLRIIANFGKQPCDAQGRPLTKEQVFAPLRRITRAQLPYVVVLDSKGGRVLAHVELSNGINEEKGYRYYVTATITPVAEVVTPTVSAV